MKAPSRGPSPGPFLRLLRKLEGEKSDFWGMGGRNAATHTPNPEKGKQLCENREKRFLLERKKHPRDVEGCFFHNGACGGQGPLTRTCRSRERGLKLTE